MRVLLFTASLLSLHNLAHFLGQTAILTPFSILYYLKVGPVTFRLKNFFHRWRNVFEVEQNKN